MMSEIIGINRETLRKIQVEDLGKRKVSAHFVPHFLNSCALVSQFLAKRSVSKWTRPAYSPDLATPDYFLLPKLKLRLKGTFFDSVKEIYHTMTQELKTIKEEHFSQAFNSLDERSKRCNDAGGDY